MQACRGISDQPESVRPVIAAPRQQPHAATFTARHEAKSIEFYFVNPAWSERRVSGSGGKAGFDEALAGSTQTKHRHGFRKLGDRSQCLNPRTLGEPGRNPEAKSSKPASKDARHS